MLMADLKCFFCPNITSMYFAAYVNVMSSKISFISDS